MRKKYRLGNASLLFFASVVWTQALGCNDQCNSSTDCKELQLCVSGKCQALNSGPSTENTDDTSDIESTASNDNETDTQSPDAGVVSTDVGTDSDTDGPKDTDGRGEGKDGSSCESGRDCASGYCDSGICCSSGTCCASPGAAWACPTTQCKTVFCDGNYQCRYYNLPLGAPDLSPFTPCVWETLCDGNGQCSAVNYCISGGYKGLGIFKSVADGLEETCRTSCASDVDCNTGFECKIGECVEKSTIPSENCASDADCAGEKCDKTLGICCASGHCCSKDEACGRYACDADTKMCFSNCRVENVDDDAACSSLGDFHCDFGWCYDDLANGGRWCDESSDCASRYCDVGRAQCCSEGSCCDTDDDCDGTRCLIGEGNYCPDTCAPSGVDDDTLCRNDYRCNAGVCVPEALADGEACESDETCSSGHCANGNCCKDGECCATKDDCGLDSMCNTPSCSANNQCVYYAFPCGASDIEGDDTCMGESLCDGFGNCVAVSDCEGGFVSNSVVCDEGTVASVCDGTCESDDNCTADYHCDNGACVEDLLPGAEGCVDNMDCKDSHCNTVTGVCCESGYCCNDNAECAEFLSECDPNTYACNFSCTEDSECAALGNYHCESSACEPDLENGERFCAEDKDCLSNYCDPGNGVCCNQGDCCVSDNECKGFACDENFSCVLDCAGDDTLCGDGYYCNIDTCLPRLPNGAECDTNGDCASNHCGETAKVCCEDGTDCCADESDCTASDDCTVGYCAASFSCVYAALNDGESCGDGLFCNGDERCDGGVCTDGTSPCDAGSPCMAVTCDEDLDDCVEIPANAGQACSEPLFCKGNVTMTCTEGGICADAGAGVSPCDTPVNPCMESVCNEIGDSCGEQPVADGMACGDDPCLGEQACDNGECVVVGARPCDDGNLCTTDACSAIGGEAVCGQHTLKQNGQACETDTCMGDGAVCMEGACIPVSDRPCADNNICTEDTCYEADGLIDCAYDQRTVRELSCGAQITIYSYEFSRELYTYNGSCTGDFLGPEIAVRVLNAIGNVTLAVTGTVPSTAIEVLGLSDVCDGLACVDHGTGGLTMQANGETIGFVLETPDAAPPSETEVSVTCE